ncbi:thiamine pyrophosphate-dependent enzyme [Geodermatophilus sp. URMC 61]|uniref:thiamine pyrophosphate-dependent enzyme n=1 Tax=Geodermatophilus sp. URMC 61 TaxID=3423411 RepID=UPI00406D27FA
MDRLLPANRLVVEDGGHFLGWAPTYLALPAPNHFLMTGTAFQVIGLGLPAAVGAARARPDATVVLCTGDGGMLMALADLDTRRAGPVPRGPGLPAAVAAGRLPRRAAGGDHRRHRPGTRPAVVRRTRAASCRAKTAAPGAGCPTAPAEWSDRCVRTDGEI